MEQYIRRESRCTTERSIFEGDLCRFVVMYLRTSSLRVVRLLPLANVPAQRSAPGGRMQHNETKMERSLSRRTLYRSHLKNVVVSVRIA